MFEKIGLVRIRGVGVDLLYQAMLNSGKEPPYYDDDGGRVRLVLVNNINEGFIKLIQNVNTEMGNIPLDELILLSLTLKSKDISITDASKALQKPEVEAREKLDSMISVPPGFLSLSSSRGKRYYRLSDRIYNIIDDDVGYYRDGEIQRVNWEERILEFIRDRGGITNQQVRSMFTTTRGKAYHCLNRMVRSGQIIMIGKTHSARYVIVDCTDI
jgi:predicted HTH transcriptional regulator